MADGRLLPRGDGSFLAGTRRNERIDVSFRDLDRGLLVRDGRPENRRDVGLSVAESSVANGGGLILFTEEPASVIHARVCEMARSYGRSDDLLLLNFQTTSLGFPAGAEVTSGFNPFAERSSKKCTSIVLDLVHLKGDSRERAERFLPSYFDVLRWLETRGVVDVGVSSFREHLSLRSVLRLVYETGPDRLPVELRRGLGRYLKSLPGFREDRHFRQSQATVDAHGYFEMQMTKVFGNLADIFGHVLTTNRAIDMDDVVHGGRILVVTLPPWERMMELDELHHWVVRLLAGSRSDDVRSEDADDPSPQTLLPVIMDRLREDVVVSIRERFVGKGLVHVEIARNDEEGPTNPVKLLVGEDEKAATIEGVEPAQRPIGRASPDRVRVASSLRWNSTASSLFHTRAERRRELETLARSNDLATMIGSEEMTFASRLSSLPITDSGKEMTKRAFAIVGSYRKIQAAALTGNTAIQPILFHLGEQEHG